MLQECVRRFLRAQDQPEVLGSVQRFGAVSHQPFLNRGTVRRGVWFIFLEFAAFEREKMLLHIFRAESGALAKRRGERPGKRKSRVCNETGRGFKWQVPRKLTRRGGEPFKPQTGLLRGKGLRGLS
jgi:hypothetical protein